MSNSIRTLALLAAALALPACGPDDTHADHTHGVLAPTPWVASDPRPADSKNPKLPSGTFEIEAASITAEVVAIDKAKRTITLKGDNGSGVIKALKDTKGFDDIKIGDRISAQVVEEMAVFLRKKGEPPSEGEAETIAMKRNGNEEAVCVTEAYEVAAQVVSVDLVHQQLVLHYATGTTAVVRAHKSIDLTKVKPGDDVVARLIERTSIEIVKK